VTVKGPKGELHQTLDPDFKVTQEENDVVVSSPTEQKRHRAMHGLYRALMPTWWRCKQGIPSPSWELIGVGLRPLRKEMYWN